MTTHFDPAPFDPAPFDPTAAVLGAGPEAAPEPAPPPVPDTAPAPDAPDADVAVATATSRGGTVAVTATDRGLPLDVRVDPRELRYGGGALTVAILDVCRAATASAKVVRREDLAAAGVRGDILDALGLPAPDEQAHRDQGAPHSWMRPL